MNKKILIIIIAAIIAISAGIGGFFVWKKYFKKASEMQLQQEGKKVEEEKPESLGEQIYQQTQNPIEKLPQSNPYETKTNPFEETKTNPYSNGYKNPFE